ncbi:MAG: septum formation protein Maf [Firmicutes bacterium]|nr:septum formation protein Maf [Bacillota bacterium]
MNVVLASASARRQELLKRLVENYQVLVSDFDESSIQFNNDCPGYVMELACGKALNVAEGLKTASLVIGCDTIVAYEGTVLGKPQDHEDAFFMLKMLSGKKHQVYSGIALVNTSNGQVRTDFAMTEVKFDQLSDEEIRRYIASGEPMDKAGAYGIQGHGGVFVEEIHGCYYNVVGLPLNKLNKMLKGIGVNL